MNSKKKYKRRLKVRQILSGLVLVFLILFLESRSVPGIEGLYDIVDRINNLIVDIQLISSIDEEQKQPENVVIIDIDEKSLAANGQWPWPRETVAGLINSLWDNGVVTVGLDILFAEPEENIIQRLLHGNDLNKDGTLRNRGDKDIIKYLNSIKDLYNGDARLAESMSIDIDGHGDVVLGYVLRIKDEKRGRIFDNGIAIPENIDPRFFQDYGGFTANLNVFQDNASNAGFFSIEPDSDGIYRRYQIISKHNNKLYPSLALALVQAYLLIEPDESYSLEAGANGIVDNIIINNHKIPVDNKGKTYIPFAGGAGTFKYISATDVINGRVDRKQLENKIVIIGTTVHGLYDLRPTPIDGAFPGVEVHANMVESLLSAASSNSKGLVKFPHTPAINSTINFSLIVIFGLIFSIIFPELTPIKLTISVVISILFIIGLTYFFWVGQNAMLTPSTPIISILLLGSLNASYGFMYTHRSRNKLRDRFSEYIPPDLVKVMVEHPEMMGNENESRNMSVLFADIRSFTTISESLNAAELKNLLNRFFTPMTYIIFEQKGTIDKYVGDMIMAFWNAPLLDEDHAQNSVVAALKMLKKLKPLQREFLDEGFPKIDIGIGINTGTMSVGDMGSAVRRSYTVIGDAVNLGSRLEGLTKYYGVNLVISEYTYAKISGIICRKLDLVKVKGKTSGVTVYNPICTEDEATPELLEELEKHHKGIDEYLSMNWLAARTIFSELSKAHPDTHVYQLYLERIANLEKRDLPDDWDGVFERREK